MFLKFEWNWVLKWVEEEGKSCHPGGEILDEKKKNLMRGWGAREGRLWRVVRGVWLPFRVGFPHGKGCDIVDDLVGFFCEGQGERGEEEEGGEAQRHDRRNNTACPALMRDALFLEMLARLARSLAPASRRLARTTSSARASACSVRVSLPFAVTHTSALHLCVWRLA